jgi:hypothetical protein
VLITDALNDSVWNDRAEPGFVPCAVEKNSILPLLIAELRIQVQNKFNTSLPITATDALLMHESPIFVALLFHASMIPFR